MLVYIIIQRVLLLLLRYYPRCAIIRPTYFIRLALFRIEVFYQSFIFIRSAWNSLARVTLVLNTLIRKLFYLSLLVAELAHSRTHAHKLTFTTHSVFTCGWIRETG